MSSELIKFLISWGPTILFSLIVIIATFVGFLRGYRKSKILAIHARWHSDSDVHRMTIFLWTGEELTYKQLFHTCQLCPSSSPIFPFWPPPSITKLERLARDIWSLLVTYEVRPKNRTQVLARTGKCDTSLPDAASGFRASKIQAV